MAAPPPDLEHLLRTEAPQVLGALVRRFGHFDIAEDAVQDALLAAAQQWPTHGEAGDLVTMEHQKRDLWDKALTAEGTTLITAAMHRRQVGPYQLQAAIAALHNGAPSYAETDWPQIAALYAWLEQLTPTPPVRLSRAVAVAMAYGPRRGLMLLDSLADDPLIRQRERAVRAHLLELNGDTKQAADLFREAAALTSNLAERRYLEGRAQHLES